MKYNIEEVVRSSFEYDDLYHHPELRHSIVYLLNPTHEKIKTARALLAEAKLPWFIDHHIKIRLELIGDILESL